MAGEGINGQKDYVEQQEQAADPYAESSTKKEPANRVAPKKDEEDEPHIKKVAMKVLQNKRKSSLASVPVLPALTHRARRRIQKESAVVSLPIVVAGDPESQRPNQNQQRRGQRPPPVVRINERGVKR